MRNANGDIYIPGYFRPTRAAEDALEALGFKNTWSINRPGWDSVWLPAVEAARFVYEPGDVATPGRLRLAAEGWP